MTTQTATVPLSDRGGGPETEVSRSRGPWRQGGLLTATCSEQLRDFVSVCVSVGEQLAQDDLRPGSERAHSKVPADVRQCGDH